MSDILGFTSIAFVSTLTLIAGLLRPNIFRILFIALILRIVVMLIGHYLVDLPSSTADARSFERYAWSLAQSGFFNVMNNYTGPDSKFISWLIAIPYSLFGRSVLMAQSISLIFGMGSIYLGWKTAKIIWDVQIANKVAWAIALFPSLILYSVLVLREVYISFFLLVALYGVVSWIKNNDYKSLILIILGFFAATFFHGAMLVGALTFLTIIGVMSFISFLKLLFKYRIKMKILMVFLIFVILSSIYLSGKITVTYLGSFESVSKIDNLLLKTDNSTRGEASYPEWTKVHSFNELFYKGPIRSLYFVFSPFPWDVKKPYHLIGLLDAFLYMYLVFLIFQNRKIIWKDPALRVLLIILLSYLIVFGVGVGNFGTGIRHRTKFTIIFILLAAPLIKKLIFIKKNKKKE